MMSRTVEFMATTTFGMQSVRFAARAAGQRDSDMDHALCALLARVAQGAVELTAQQTARELEEARRKARTILEAAGVSEGVIRAVLGLQEAVALPAKLAPVGVFTTSAQGADPMGV